MIELLWDILEQSSGLQKIHTALNNPNPKSTQSCINHMIIILYAQKRTIILSLLHELSLFTISYAMCDEQIPVSLQYNPKQPV